MSVTYRNCLTGATLAGTVVYVHPQTGELLVVRADNGRREYVRPDSVTEATPA